MNYLLIFLLFLTACSDIVSVENPDIKKVRAQEDIGCSFNNDIQWELDHGITANQLIQALKACESPRFKRGQIFVEKDNINCTFQVYYTEVVYPDRLRGRKIQPLYIGAENCNGLVDDFHSNLESDLLIRHKRK